MKAFPDDFKLLEAYIEGDAQAFQKIFQRYAATLLSFLTLRLHNPEWAEEVLQESFLKFHRRREKLDPKFPLLQHLYVVARSEMIDFIRKNSKTLSAAIEDSLKNQADMSQNPEERSLLRQDLEELLKPLSSEHREILVARLLWDESFESLAQKHQSSAANMRQILGRALNKIKGSSKT